MIVRRGCVLCCALLVRAGLGFVALNAGRAAFRQELRSPESALRPMRASPRVSMSTTNAPRFTLPLMDDTRVSFAFTKDHVQKLASEVSLLPQLWPPREPNAKRYIIWV